MWRKNLIIAWRNLLKNKWVSSINILGLTLGVSASLLAILFAVHELTFENGHINADRIATVYLSANYDKAGGGEQRMPVTFGPEGEALKNIFPEIETATLSRNTDAVVRVGENLFDEKNILLADADFFPVFTIPFISGSPSSNPESVVLSEHCAEKYFGSQPAMGQTVTVDLFGEKTALEVTGVYQDLPSNTHLKAGLIIPLSLADRFSAWKYRDYESVSYNNYLLLKPGTDMQELSKKIAASFKIPVESGGNDLKVSIVPLKKMHFSGAFDNNRGKLIVFLSGGLFMLITSCFNYINLTNIIFSTRAKETGIRKTSGGTSGNLFALFFSDSMLSTFLAFTASLVILYFALPWFNRLADTHISLTSDWRVMAIGILLYLITVLLCGLYPALKYSAAKPVKLLTAGFVSARDKNYSANILTAFQFFLAALFVQVLLVMNRQNTYLSDSDVTHFNPENVFCLPGDPWGDLKRVKEELLRDPDIEAVSWGSSIPEMGVGLTKDWIDDQNKVFAGKYFFEKDYPEVYKIKMLKGRFFSASYSSDQEQNLVINQKAADKLDFPDPVGRRIQVEGKFYTIIGVIDNYLAQPPIFGYMPMLIRQSGEQGVRLLIRISPGNRQAACNYIETTLKKFNPDYPVDLKYHTDFLYEQEEGKSYISAGYLMNLFFTLTILTSLVGLFGLSVFIAQRGRKEVGIRKVCGASVGEIIYILSKGILGRMCLATGIATLFSFFIGQMYLSVFPVNFKPGIFFFLTGAALSILVLVLTISWQTWRAATRNPVEALRYE